MWRTFGHEYDFGNGWEHDIVLECIVDGVDVPDAVCLGGGRWWNGGGPHSTPSG